MGMDSEDEDDMEMAEMRAAIQAARQRSAEAIGEGSGRRPTGNSSAQRGSLAAGSGQASLEELKAKRERMQEHTAHSSAFFAERPGGLQQDQGERRDTSEVKEAAKRDEDDDEDDEQEDEDDQEGPQAGSARDGTNGLAGALPVDDDDLAERHEGLRAAFPVAFGRQETEVTPLESVHSQTKRQGDVASGELHQSHARTQEDKNQKGAAFNKKSVSRGGDQRPIKFAMPQRLGLSGDSQGPESNGKGRSIGPRMVEERAKEGNEGLHVIGPPRRPPSKGLLDATDEEDEEGGRIGPPRPPPSGRLADGGDHNDDDDDDDEDDDDGDEDEYRVPLSNEVLLKGHTRVVAALAVDPTGARVISGGYDYTIRMYDFGGMDAKLRSFRQLEPSEGHQVRAVSWSPSADLFIVITGSAQAKVYNRDGFTQGEFVRGDMYIRDLKNTKGHISGLTAGEWHPVERHTALTSSEDGSVRIWDTANFKTQKQVVKPRLARPGRISVTACTWGPDGRNVAAGLVDGSLQVWNVKGGWGSRPDLFLATAHARDEDVTGLLFSADGHMLASRSTDATLKVWDLRKFQKPLADFQDLPNIYPQTNLAWSPDERLLVTGTSAEQGTSGGQLVFFDKDRLELVRRTGVHERSVVKVLWHPRLNQIFATSGDKKEGATHILYDPALSERGALSCVARAPRKARAEDISIGVAPPVIHNPHALPLFREQPSRKRQREKDRKDPVASKRPDLPVEGPGFGGRVGKAKNSLLTQYLLREGGLQKEIWMDEDPRAAILRYAEESERDPQIIAPAYAKTQPKPVFEEEEEEDAEGK
eukprot:TRINITY_DN16869_c0_g1_i2.p1 TRINITY_DN16869_c0_g1~~TRINITY_DN16869_c0_g1_i2.p1  ORF type:complete len:815 (-),score=192.18 TRINITY_DN16869_c0_g1_i2:440-2884(-)